MDNKELIKAVTEILPEGQFETDGKSHDDKLLMIGWNNALLKIHSNLGKLVIEGGKSDE